MSEESKAWGELRGYLHGASEHEPGELFTRLVLFPPEQRVEAARYTIDRLGDAEGVAPEDLLCELASRRAGALIGALIPCEKLTIGWAPRATVEADLLDEVDGELAHISGVDGQVRSSPRAIFRVLDTFLERHLVDAFAPVPAREHWETGDALPAGPGPYGSGLRALGGQLTTRQRIFATLAVEDGDQFAEDTISLLDAVFAADISDEQAVTALEEVQKLIGPERWEAIEQILSSRQTEHRGPEDVDEAIYGAAKPEPWQRVELLMRGELEAWLKSAIDFGVGARHDGLTLIDAGGERVGVFHDRARLEPLRERYEREIEAVISQLLDAFDERSLEVHVGYHAAFDRHMEHFLGRDLVVTLIDERRVLGIWTQEHRYYG